MNEGWVGVAQLTFAVVVVSEFVARPTADLSLATERALCVDAALPSSAVAGSQQALVDIWKKCKITSFSSHLISSHSILSFLVLSPYLFSSHLLLHFLIFAQLILYFPTLNQLFLFHLLFSHLIFSHLFLSHLLLHFSS